MPFRHTRACRLRASLPREHRSTKTPRSGAGGRIGETSSDRAPFLERVAHPLRDELATLVNAIKTSSAWSRSKQAKWNVLGGSLWSTTHEDQVYKQWSHADKPTLRSLRIHVPSMTSALADYSAERQRAASLANTSHVDEAAITAQNARATATLLTLLTRMIVLHTIVVSQMLPPLDWIDKTARRWGLLKGAAWAVGSVALLAGSAFFGGAVAFVAALEGALSAAGVSVAVGLGSLYGHHQANRRVWSSLFKSEVVQYEEAVRQIYAEVCGENDVAKTPVAKLETDLFDYLAKQKAVHGQDHHFDLRNRRSFTEYASRLCKHISMTGEMRATLRRITLGLRIGPLGPSHSGKTRLLADLWPGESFVFGDGQGNRTRSFDLRSLGRGAVMIDVPGIDDLGAAAANGVQASLHPAKLAMHLLDVVVVLIEANKVHNEVTEATLKTVLEGAMLGSVSKPFIILISKADTLLSNKQNGQRAQRRTALPDDDALLQNLADEKRVVLSQMRSILKAGPSDATDALEMYWPQTRGNRSGVDGQEFWVRTRHRLDSLVHFACFADGESRESS